MARALMYSTFSVCTRNTRVLFCTVNRFWVCFLYVFLCLLVVAVVACVMYGDVRERPASTFSERGCAG
jgi:hypothetical protein